MPKIPFLFPFCYTLSRKIEGKERNTYKLPISNSFLKNILKKWGLSALNMKLPLPPLNGEPILEHL
jgi:hypothetical protein